MTLGTELIYNSNILVTYYLVNLREYKDGCWDPSIGGVCPAINVLQKARINIVKFSASCVAYNLTNYIYCLLSFRKQIKVGEKFW